MTNTATVLEPEATSRPYHHGDLRRALTEAALRIVQRDGLPALSLRAVAREAGVSPAAPYHHFKDKQELMTAVGAEGFGRLGEVMLEVKARAATPLEALTALGVAYVCFARENPALYTLMWDCSRHESGTPGLEPEKHAYQVLEDTIVEAGVASPDDPVGLKLAAISAWTKAHGLAGMAGFDQFAPLKDALGGEKAFFAKVISFNGHAHG
jgi:AcrR family transcriptional regulator